MIFSVLCRENKQHCNSLHGIFDEDACAVSCDIWCLENIVHCYAKSNHKWRHKWCMIIVHRECDKSITVNVSIYVAHQIYLPHFSQCHLAINRPMEFPCINSRSLINLCVYIECIMLIPFDPFKCTNSWYRKEKLSTNWRIALKKFPEKISRKIKSKRNGKVYKLHWITEVLAARFKAIDHIHVTL